MHHTIALGLALGFAAACSGSAASQGTAASEVITLRSGQGVNGPGQIGQTDPLVTFRPINPPGVPTSDVVFTPADFQAAIDGPNAVIIRRNAAWTSGLSDPDPRWINYAIKPNQEGQAGSTLYAVPFTVAAPAIQSAQLDIEYACDDWLGDWFEGGPNPVGLYVNGESTGYQGQQFQTPTAHQQDITPWVTPGENHLFLYVRDAGIVVSGLIFDITITVTPGVDCVADVNRDGMLTPADFNAWVLAFNNQSPACDQNGDGQCTPADFNAWVLNFNAGCP
ncbi:MAG: GC-type dockerin domain-anchored protein [Planctomycetota bacterium]